MPKVLAGEAGGPNGLKFMARKSTVSPADISCKVVMNQQGSFVELRNKQNELLFRLNGNQLDELYSKNQLDVTRPEKLKDSVIRCWEHQRAEPSEPLEFVLDLKNIDPEQLKGRLKMLLDWLDEHIENDVAVDPHKEEEQPVEPEASELPESTEPEESAPPAGEPAPDESSPEPPADDGSAPPASPEESAPPEGEEPEEPEEEEPEAPASPAPAPKSSPKPNPLK